MVYNIYYNRHILHDAFLSDTSKRVITDLQKLLKYDISVTLGEKKVPINVTSSF